MSNGRAHTQAVVTSEDVEQRTSWRYFALTIVLAVFTAPYRRAFKLYTWRPLKEIRAANGDSKVLVPLVREWKADKYAELQSVQVAATFCGGANFSILPYARSSTNLWYTDALFFASLMCSIWAIVTTIQTKAILDDLPSREQLNPSLSEDEVRRMRRSILRYKRSPGINHWIMIFVWQFPSMTMAYAWCTFLTGLTVYMCTPFIQNMPWQDRHKVAIAYLAVGFVGLITYIFATAFVYLGEKDFERSVASSHTNTRLNTNDLEAGSPAADSEATGVVKKDFQSFDAMNSVQSGRIKALIGFQHEERVKRELESFERAAKRQLLY